MISKLKDAEKKAEHNAHAVVKTELNKAIKFNFAEQGRPAKWKPKKRNDGRAILSGRTGNGQRSINIQDNESTHEFSIGSKIIYMRVHQEGADIKHPARKYNFRETRRGTNVFARAGHKNSFHIPGKAYTVHIPARPWAVWTQADTQRAVPLIAKAIEGSFI